MAKGYIRCAFPRFSNIFLRYPPSSSFFVLRYHYGAPSLVSPSPSTWSYPANPAALKPSHDPQNVAPSSVTTRPPFITRLFRLFGLRKTQSHHDLGDAAPSIPVPYPVVRPSHLIVLALRYSACRITAFPSATLTYHRSGVSLDRRAPWNFIDLLWSNSWKAAQSRGLHPRP